MTLNQIKALPTVRDNIHESVFRSYHILQRVIDMVNRNDSNKTIKEVIEHLLTGEPEKEVIIKFNNENKDAIRVINGKKEYGTHG